MSQGRAPFNFVDNMPHDGWRQQLPYVIDMYVQNITYFLKESVSFWYRPNPASACSSGDTYANTASQLQLEFPAAEVMEDSVFYSALLNKPAIPHVTIGGTVFTGTWSQTPDNGVGIYHGSVPFNGATGKVLVEIDRDGVAIVNAEGAPITASCDMVNWNAYTGGAESTVELTFGLPDLLDSKVCVNGTGAYSFAGLCEFTCRYGYCPLGACLCREMGNQKALPKALNVNGYPAAGLDASYSGLCAFACNYGYCPSNACSDTPSPLVVPTVSPFLPPTCTGGTGTGAWEGLCSYACNFGMCPSQRCTCTSQGTLNLPPPITRDTTGFDSNPDEDDWGLCRFACPRGYCPPPCNQKATDGTGDTVYVDPSIWGPDSGLIPVVGCDPPCNVVLPPYTLPSPTTILCAPLTTTLTEIWSLEVPQVVVSTISFTDITTTAIPVYNLNITDGLVNSMTYSVTPSVFCSTTITVTDPSCSQTDTASCSETYYVSTTPTPPITITSSHKTSVSFTSTATPTPTCTKPGGCGGQSCSGPHCGGCDGSGCHTDSKGGGTDHDDKGCVGSGCGGDSGPPGGGGLSGGGSGGGGDGDDDSCTSSTTVTDTTVFCTLYPTIGSSDVQTTCTSTEYDTTAGCSIRAIETTSYTSVGCPTLPAYVPPVPGLNDLLPTPGPQNPLGIILNSGTYTYDSMGASPTSTTTGPTAVPTNPDGSAASYEIQWWQNYQADDGDPPAWSYTTWYLFGYDGDISDHCNSDASFVIESSSTALSAAIPDSLPHVIVYKDDCVFTKSSMALTCASFKPATCEDIEQQSGGTCQQTTTNKVEWQGLVRCKWD